MRLLYLITIIPIILSGCATSGRSVYLSDRILYYQSDQLPINTANSTPINSDSVHVILPIPTGKVTPTYHPNAVRARIEGNVVVQVLLDTTGSPKKGIIMQTDAEIFNDACLMASLKWKFTPLLIDGIPHPFVAQLKFGFSLNNNSEPQVNLPF